MRKTSIVIKKDENGVLDRRRRDEAPEVAFQFGALTQVFLPRAPSVSREFVRTCGRISMTLRAGSIWDGSRFVDQPLPSGVWPRLLLIYFNTEAVRRGSPEIDLGSSAADCLERVSGVKSGGGVRGSLTRFKQQALALSASSMIFGFGDGVTSRASTFQGQLVQELNAWIAQEGGQRALWNGSVILSPSYFEVLRTSAVPLEKTAVRALKSSALALDIYMWLVQRLYRLEKPLRLTWGHLREQFGAEYKVLKDFKTPFSVAMRAVLAVYPGAQVLRYSDKQDGGWEFHYSPPPVEIRRRPKSVLGGDESSENSARSGGLLRFDRLLPERQVADSRDR